MKVVAFLFLALIATSYANQALFKSLAKISKDPTGALILSAISLNLKAKASLDEVAQLLQDILNDLLAQSQKFESDTSAENDRLTTAIANDQALQQAYESAINTLTGTLETSQSSLATNQDSLANNQQALATEQQGIQDRDAAAAVDIPQFDSDLQDIANALEAIEEATNKMRTYQQSSEGTTAFIQMGTSIKDKIKKATETMQSMKKKLAKHSNMFTPLLRELIDLSSSLNQSNSQKVIDLLTQLHQLLTDAQSQTETQRATYVTDYESRQATANDNVANYEATIDQLNQTIQGLTDKIAQAQSDLESTQQSLADNQAKLSADQASLEALQADYTVRRARYDRLISLVRQCIDFFNQNLAGVDEYVSQQIQASL